MRTKAKTFDCVEMKRRAQEKLIAEYEARRGEFSSFAEFINTPAPDEPKWIKAVRSKARRSRA